MSILYKEAVSITPELLLSLVATAYGVAVYALFARGRFRRQARRNRFFHALNAGLSKGAVQDIEDVVNLYKGATGIGSEDIEYRYDLSKELRAFLVELLTRGFGRAMDQGATKEWMQKIGDLIRKNEETSPYAELPAAERNALRDMALILAHQDLEGVRRKTLEIAGMIQARYDDFLRMRTLNKWTTTLSVLGLLLTIAFGLLAFAK